MEPRLEFAATADGIRIAWTSVGDGPTVVFMPGVPLSNLEAEWRIPPGRTGSSTIPRSSTSTPRAPTYRL